MIVVIIGMVYVVDYLATTYTKNMESTSRHGDKSAITRYYIDNTPN